ncbi:MAG: hypothetical protein EP344_14160 [Bacteroidetes bacterium]|nr:MAG: hypothetical protein EP344_14160 [Bacteroidota bacterium]
MLDPENKSTRIARLFWTTLLVAAGLAHFQAPGFFLNVMPPYLPVPATLIGLTGLLEWMLAASLWRPALRYKAWLAIAVLLILYLPVHVYTVTNHAEIPPLPFYFPLWAAWLRLGLQLVFIGWTWRLYQSGKQAG